MIEVGEYITRKGEKAVVLTTDAPGPWPCVGYCIGYDIKGNPISFARAWCNNGKWFVSGNESDNDLISKFVSV